MVREAMSWTDEETGITHEGSIAREDAEGRTLCGVGWFLIPSWGFRETKAEIDCMACVAHKALTEDLLSLMDDVIKRWHDNVNVVFSIHDEIIVP